MSLDDANAVLHYWFGGGDPSKRPKWFGGGDAAAQEIREKFGSLVEKARNDELKDWEENPQGTFALILLQDQFCRSLYSGTSKAFDRDPYCEKLARKFVDPEVKTHDHLKFSIAGRQFLYLPLEHAESLEAQELSVKLFAKLKEDAKGTPDENSAAFTLTYAEKHKKLIEAFGRYPARNAAIGRESTPEEKEFLANPWPGYTF